jgi:hypothetical protein
VLDALGIRGSDADVSVPHTRAALDLLAAGAVAGAASEAPAGLPVEFSGAAPSAVDESIAPAFHAIYIALSRDPETQTLAPTVRAARALALARSATDGTQVSARARAAAAWAVLPRVFPGAAEVFSSEVPRQERDELPSLQLVSRAGESLSSLVAPTARPAAARGEPSRGYAVPSVAPELVETSAVTAAQVAPSAGPDAAPAGAPAPTSVTASSKSSDGFQIPEWFSRAAKEMFESGDDSGMSVAEMVLVQTAPKEKIAASAVEAAAPQAAAPQGGEAAAQKLPDVTQIARDVYTELCRMFEIARERNGDPWQA